MNNNKHEVSDTEERRLNDPSAHWSAEGTAYDKLLSAYSEMSFRDGTGKHERKGVKTLSEAISQKASRVVEIAKKIINHQGL